MVTVGNLLERERELRGVERSGWSCCRVALQAGKLQSRKLVLQEPFCVSSDRKQGVKDKHDSC
jgi:hypothetical protein